MIKGLIALVVVGGLAVGAYAFVFRGAKHDPNADVPTYTVKTEHFVRQVDAEGDLRAVKATPITVPPPTSDDWNSVKIAWVAPDGSRIKKDDVVVRFDPTTLEKQLQEGQADLSSATARLGSETIAGHIAIAGRDDAAVMADKELEQTRKFQSKDTDIYSRNQIVESAIDEKLASERKTNAETTKSIERNLSQSKVDLIDVDAKKAKTAIKNAKSALASMAIKAPHDGLFIIERDRKGEPLRVGDDLWPTQKVANIPLLETLEAEVYVLEVDASGLNTGQQATLTIEAHPDQPFKGKVRLVEKLAKPLFYKVPVQYFQVIVELDKTDLSIMKPGQRVAGKLVLDQTDALVVPRQVVLQKDGKAVVYRKTATGTFEPIAVELGAATSGRVVVKTGLAAGDVLAMRDPTHTADEAISGSGSGAAGAPKPSAGGGGGGGGGGMGPGGPE